MAKRKRTTQIKTQMMEAPKPPSLQDQMKWSAENMARTVAENHPKFKKMRDHITRSVMTAAKKAVGESARRGRFGG